MRWVKMAVIVALAASALLLSGSGTAPEPAPLTAPAPFATVEEFVRACTVQIIVHVEKYTRTVTWYREVTADGKEGEWKARYSPWSTKPELISVAGSGVIIHSGPKLGTIILTNYHVVEYLIRRESLGTPSNPIPIYAPEDLTFSDYPPRVIVRDGARPIAEQYLKLFKDRAVIKHSEDQIYEVAAKVVHADQLLDVALVQLEGVFGLPYTTFRTTPARVGEEVLICGAPLGIPFSLDRGRVNQVNLNLGMSGGIRWDRQIKLDIAAAPGSSGSGIFDLNGNLIGVLHGVLVYSGNFIRGGQLAIDGLAIREWLMWTGWASVVFQPPYGAEP